MKYIEFEALAWEMWDEIPDEYKEGVDGLVIRREALPHAALPDVYTLGECHTEPYPSEVGGPDTTRSVVVLYYGSFWRLSRLDDEFDWEAELWETITHELQHHLESLASEDALEEMDYAADENFKRLEGEPFDPFFYRSGEKQAPGVFRVENHFFIEVPVSAASEAPLSVEFSWQARPYRVPVPRDPGDICFVEVDGGVPDSAPGVINVVVIRRQGALAGLARWLSRRPAEVRQWTARAESVA